MRTSLFGTRSGCSIQSSIGRSCRQGKLLPPRGWVEQHCGIDFDLAKRLATSDRLIVPQFNDELPWRRRVERQDEHQVRPHWILRSSCWLGSPYLASVPSQNADRTAFNKHVRLGKAGRAQQAHGDVLLFGGISSDSARALFSTRGSRRVSHDRCWLCIRDRAGGRVWQVYKLTMHKHSSAHYVLKRSAHLVVTERVSRISKLPDFKSPCKEHIFVQCLQTKRISGATRIRRSWLKRVLPILLT